MRGDRPGGALDIVGGDALEQLHVLGQGDGFGAGGAHGFIVKLFKPMQHGLRKRYVDRIARHRGDAAVKGQVGFEKPRRIIEAGAMHLQQQAQLLDLLRGGACCRATRHGHFELQPGLLQVLQQIA